MTVVNPKSISGINSITTGSGSDDILTIHTNNGTERLRVDSTGATKIVTGIVTTLTATTGIVTTLTTNTLTANSTAKVGSGVTLSPDGDVFATGVTTSTTFVGALTGNVTGNISGGTVAGSTGTFTGDVSIADKIVHTGDTNAAIRFPEADTLTVETNGAERIRIQSNGNTGIGTITAQNNARLQVSTNQQVVAAFEGTGGSDPQIYIGDDMTTPTDNVLVIGYDKADNRGYLTVGGDADTVFQVKNGGDIEIGVGNLKFGTSGNGIDFSATGDGSGTMSNELLDDYEEGTWTPAYHSGVTSQGSYSNTSGNYTKIGDVVYFTARLQMSGSNANYHHVIVQGLPFSASSSKKEGGVSIGYGQALNQSNAEGKPTGHIAQGASSINFYEPDGDALYANNSTFVNLDHTLHFRGFYFT